MANSQIETASRQLEECDIRRTDIAAFVPNPHIPPDKFDAIGLKHVDTIIIWESLRRQLVMGGEIKQQSPQATASGNGVLMGTIILDPSKD